MKKVTLKITAQGLTLNNNEVVEITASYKGYTTNLVVFYNADNKVLSAQVGGLWFTPEKPLCNFLEHRIASEVISEAINWANAKYADVKAAFDAAPSDDYEMEYYVLCDVEAVIAFADNSNFIAQCEHEIEEQELKLAEELRLSAIEAEWLKYPRIEKPKSYDLPLEVEYDLIAEGLTICYKTKKDLEFMYLSYQYNGRNGSGRIDHREIESPIGKTVRGWYEEGEGYSGGHVSQSDYPTWNAKPNKQASYYMDTTESGLTGGYYPSMLSF